MENKKKTIKIDMVSPEDEVCNQPKDWVDNFKSEWNETTKTIKIRLKKEKQKKILLKRDSSSVRYY